jgi:hypothetical protein
MPQAPVALAPVPAKPAEPKASPHIRPKRRRAAAAAKGGDPKPPAAAAAEPGAKKGDPFE